MTVGKLQVLTTRTREADDAEHPGTEMQRTVSCAGSAWVKGTMILCTEQ